MTRGRLLTTAAVIVLSLVSTSTLHGQSEQRSIYASVTDSSDLPVPNLGPQDFVIREDKVAREVLGVTLASDPMDIALIIDNSEAAEPYIREYREAISAFIRDIVADETGAKHRLAIITVGERPVINTDYTSDAALAIKGAQRIFAQPGTGTYLLDGLMETSRGIAKRGSARPVIIAIDTEGPELSNRDHRTVMDALGSSGAAFHAVVIGQPANHSNDRLTVLATGTRATGGRYDTILTASALTARLRRIAAELTHQYRVTYARPRTLIPPSQIAISGADPKLTVRGIPVREARDTR